jgi:hypothetical protein
MSVNVLNATCRGSGTPALLNMIAGRFSEVIASNIPGTIRAAAAGNKTSINQGARMGNVFHVNATEQWVSAPDLGTVPQTPTWTTHATRLVTEYGVAGFMPCLTTAGPGIVTAWINEGNGGATRVGRWDFLTGAVTFFDQVGTADPNVDAPCRGMLVLGNLLYLQWDMTTGTTVRTQVFDIETGAFASSAPASFVGQAGGPLATSNGNVYMGGLAFGNFMAFYVWLGGVWVQQVVSTISVVNDQEAGVLTWGRDGKINCVMYSSAGGGGVVWGQYDPSTGIVTDLSSSLDPIIQTGGGLDIASSANAWKYGFYVDTETLGAPRYMIQIAVDSALNNPGVVLFEHTTGPDAVVLVSDTAINTGSNCLNCAPLSSAHLNWSEGGLWGVMSAKPAKDDDGVLLTFRFGGDPGNADTNLYLQYTAPPGAPKNLGTLSAPVGGLGQVGASLVDTGGGVWHVHGWDADGATDLTVVHKIVVPDGVPSGTETGWSMKASKNELTP